MDGIGLVGIVFGVIALMVGILYYIDWKWKNK